MQSPLIHAPPHARVLRVADGRVPRATLSRLAREGELVRVLPGTYVRAEDAAVRQVRLAAACAWARGSCLWGRSALDAATGNTDPFGKAELIELAGAAKHPQPGIHWYRARLPSDLVACRDGLWFARPLVVAVSEAGRDGGVAVDRLLLRDPELGEDLARALAWFDGRTGNRARREAVGGLHQRPWSGLERELHRVLRRSGLRGWVANRPTKTPFGWFVPDVLFEAERLVVEADSWEYHSSPQAFEDDRLRQNRIVLAGFDVLRFTGAMIDDDPSYVIATLTAKLRSLRRARTRPG